MPRRQDDRDRELQWRRRCASLATLSRSYVATLMNRAAISAILPRKMASGQNGYPVSAERSRKRSAASCTRATYCRHSCSPPKLA